MSISNVGASPYAALLSSQVGASTGVESGAATAAAGAVAADNSSRAPSDGSAAAIAYLKTYLKESPAQRMQDAWLAKHNLTEQQLAAMPSALQDAIKKQMASDIQKELQDKTGGKSGTIANVTA